MHNHTAHFQVTSREGDWNNLCRPSALLGFLQEAGVEAGARGGLDRPAMLARYNAVWLLARTWVRLDRPLWRGAALTVQTWHRGQTGARMLRDFALCDDDGPLGRAVTMWVPVRVDTGRPMRLTEIRELHGTDGGELCYVNQIPALRLDGGGMEPAGRRRVGYSDLDINRHMNNTRYMDAACDALPLSDLDGHWVRELQIGYLGQCLPGEELALFIGREGDRRTVLGAVEGAPRFEAALMLEKL